MKVTARTDYALRAALVLAEAHPRLVKGEVLAAGQGLPLRFLENILLDLRRAGILGSRRGTEGGYWLASEPSAVTVADVARAAGGFLERHVEGAEPLPYEGASRHLGEVWTAVDERVRGVVETLTLADVLAGRLNGRRRSRQVRAGDRTVDIRSSAASASATILRTSSPAGTSSSIAPTP